MNKLVILLNIILAVNLNSKKAKCYRKILTKMERGITKEGMFFISITKSNELSQRKNFLLI